MIHDILLWTKDDQVIWLDNWYPIIVSCFFIFAQLNWVSHFLALLSDSFAKQEKELQIFYYYVYVIFVGILSRIFFSFLIASALALFILSIDYSFIELFILYLVCVMIFLYVLAPVFEKGLWGVLFCFLSSLLSIFSGIMLFSIEVLVVS